MFYQSSPKVSCCLCTYDRLDLAKRSIECFAKQSYSNKELIVVTEGSLEFKEQLKQHIETFPEVDIKTVFLDGERTLGEVRNISIKESSGDLYCQWDDDDFNHPKRLAVQIDYMLKQKSSVCFLMDQLHYYWQTNELFWEKWDYQNCPDRCTWIPGTIIMKMDERFSYPETGNWAKAGEDVILVDQLWKLYITEGFPISCLEDKGYHHVYSYHGDMCKHENTFDFDHHRYLSLNRSFLKADMESRMQQIVQSLDLIGLNDEVKVMGRDGLAFTYRR